MSSTKNQISVLLVDDHPIVRKGVRSLLERRPDIRVVGEAGDGREGIALAGEMNPDVILMDISMPGINGIEATRSITHAHPEIRMVALSIHSSPQFIRDMFKAGAVGYLLKESAPEELVEAIYAVMRGEVYLSTAVTGKVVSGFVINTSESMDSAAAVDTADNDVDAAGIVHTKIQRPEVPAAHVHRSRLIEKLNKGLQNPLTLVLAPPGYGKTIAVSCWLEQTGGYHAWLSLDPNDDNPPRFIRYLIAAIESLFPNSLPETTALLEASTSVPIKAVTARLINEMGAIDQDFILVIDDVQHLRHDGIGEVFDKLLRYPPKDMHLVLIGRRDPFLPLSKLRALNRVSELRAADLRFTAEETADLLKEMAGGGVDMGTAALWAEKTEGWVAGLHLAGLALSQSGRIGIPPDLPDNIQYIMEYLFDEVLANQPAGIRRYLISTAILKRFCAPLCTAVAEAPHEIEEGEPDGHDFINYLKKENLFTVELDAAQQWYRFHPLFRRLLGNQLNRSFSDNDIATLHIRASDWFAENGLAKEAIRHALRAGDMQRADQLVERHRYQMCNNSRWRTLERWIAMFPKSAAARNPELLLARMWISYYRDQFDRIPPLIDALESILDDTSKAQGLKAEIDFFKGVFSFFRGDGPRSYQLLAKAREDIPEMHYGAKGLADMYFGFAGQMNGLHEEVVDDLSALLLTPSLTSSRKIRVVMALACIHLIQGDLSTALRYNRQLRDLARHANSEFGLGWHHYLHGNIRFQRNELDESIGHFREAIAYGRMLRRVVTDSMAGLVLACQADGRTEESAFALDDLRQRVQAWNDLDAESVAASCGLRLAVIQGSRPVDPGATDADPVHPGPMVIWLEIPAITRCRALITGGTKDSLQKAESRLREMLDFNQGHHNKYQSIGIMVLLAAALYRQDRQKDALAVLKEVLAMAAPGGWIRPFVEAGPPMTAMLEQLVPAAFSAAYIERLRGAVGEPPASAPEGSHDEIDPMHWNALQPLIEPLTNRERDILELLAKRWQNKEIADELFVSPETVKSHLKNIYQKLDAPSRIKAVEKARRLGLLPEK